MSHKRERQHRADQATKDSEDASQLAPGAMTLVESELGSVQRKQQPEGQNASEPTATQANAPDAWSAIDGLQCQPGETIDAFSDVIQSIGAVQRARSSAAPTPADIEQRAAAGVASGGGAVPYASKMESAFGTSFAGVKAHTGPEAQMACDSIGAQAYASGNSVAFKTDGPSESLVAHELTHVLQQRAGVQRKGAAESSSLEAEADAVGARVAAGESVADVTSKYSGGSSGSGAVQRKAGSEGSAGHDEVVATGHTPADDVAGFSGPSAAVDQQTAASVGAATGVDVSGARVHDNPAANQLAAAMGAKAVSAGADIAVAKGENINQAGNKVLAHELAHVAQSGGSRGGALASLGGSAGPAAVEVGAPNSAAEVEADILAEKALATAANKSAKAATGSVPREVPDLPPERLSPAEREHLKTYNGKRVLRGWSTNQVLSESLDLWPSNLVVKMKNPPNIVNSLYTGAWQPEVYFNHEWSIGGKGRFLLGGVQHASWDDGNSWTKLAGVPGEKLAVPADDYAGAKIGAEASMTRRPDFHWNDQTVRVAAPVYSYKTAFDAAPTVSADGIGFDSANRAPFGATDFMASSQAARNYTVTYTQSVSKSVSDSATSTFGHTTQYSEETSVGGKASASKGKDETGKLGVEASYGKKWTETETAAAQRAMGTTFTELTQTSNSFSINFPIPGGIHAVVLVVPVTKKVTSTFSMRGVNEAGMIVSGDSPSVKKVVEANVPKGLMAFYGYDTKYATALEKHYTECMELYRKGKGLPVPKQEAVKRQLEEKINTFSKENQPSFERAMEHAEAALKASTAVGGQTTKNSNAVSGDNILRYQDKIKEIYGWATSA